jgi:uncharacterized lipoprotein YddW (UPF0748 family)
MDDAERRHFDARARTDVTLVARRYPLQWTAFRQDRLTQLVARVGETARALRPAIVVSAAVVPDADEALSKRLQNWPQWLERSLLDLLCPMTYTDDASTFERQVADARRLAGSTPVWAGVGAYRLSRAATLAHIEAARRQHAAGVALFSYDALVTPPNDPASLASLGRAAFGATP